MLRTLLTLLLALPAAPAPRALEVPDAPITQLLASPVDVVGSVVDVIRTRERGTDRSLWSFSVEIERVVQGENLKPGTRIAVGAWTRAPRGLAESLGHRSSFGGTNGLPRNGDRVRVHAQPAEGGLEALLPNGFQPTEPMVAFVAADDEYRSEITLPMLAELFQKDTGARTGLVLAADGETGAPDVASKTANTGLAPLHQAHVAVLYLRYSRDVELAKTLDAFARDGRPIVALRTATHAFAFGAESPLGELDNGFGERVIGAPWRWHHGHGSGTHILPPEEAVADHPILRGVREALAERPLVPSWLYVVEPLPEDCRVLLWGETAEPGAAEHPQARQPILWVRETQGEGAPRRMAYTSLGHPGDLELPAVRRLVLQMVLWAVGDEVNIPEQGLPARPTSPYVAPPTR